MSKFTGTSQFDFHSLIDASPALMWLTDENSQCTYLSKAWYDFTGRTPEQDLGIGWLENIHPDDLPEVARVYTQAVSDLGVLKVDYRLRNKDGFYRWFVDLGHPRFAEDGRFIGYIGTVTDIHERVLTEQDFKTAQIRFERSARATDLGVWYCDLPFDVLIWNDQVKNHFWLPPDAHVTIKTFYERIHPDDREMTRLAIEESNLKKRHYDIVYRTTNPSNEKQIKFIRAVGWTDFNVNGDPVRFDGLTLDITADRNFQAQLQEAKAVAESANLAKSEFLANMSHEIRTPLGAILGFTDLLRDPNISPREQLNYFETITRNGKALTRLVDDILDLAKVESGKIEIETIEVSLYDLLQEATGLFQERAKEKSIYLLLSVDDNVPNTVCTDPTRLRQILINLVGNAVKFTNSGGVKVKVSADTSSAGRHRLTFKIEDTGVGIEPEKRSKLFLPFAQADSSTTRKFGGTGLGLALSQRLAHALGGDIQLENKVSKAGGESGSTFVFSYAVAVPQVATRRPTPTSQPAAVSASEVSIAGKRILVVDDSADNRLLVSRVLTRVGAEVALAVNGLEAVEKATASEYDMILMDIQMPEMDGYAATRALRSRGYAKPIVALSAHAMEEDQRRSLEAGCNAHLTKPVNQRAIYEVIKSMTG